MPLPGDSDLDVLLLPQNPGLARKSPKKWFKTETSGDGHVLVVSVGAQRAWPKPLCNLPTISPSPPQC